MRTPSPSKLVLDAMTTEDMSKGQLYRKAKKKKDTTLQQSEERTFKWRKKRACYKINDRRPEIVEHQGFLAQRSFNQKHEKSQTVVARGQAGSRTTIKQKMIKAKQHSSQVKAQKLWEFRAEAPGSSGTSGQTQQHEHFRAEALGTDGRNGQTEP